jgi:hypothetical protein
MNRDIGKDIEQNPCTPFYLKRAWNEFKEKDPVDALYAAKTLVLALEQNLECIAKDLGIRHGEYAHIYISKDQEGA